MIYNKILEDIRSSLGRDYLFVDEVENYIKGLKAQQNFIDFNKGVIIYYKLPIDSFLKGFQDRYIDVFSEKVSAYQTMNESIIFTYKDRIIFRIVVNKNTDYPYRAILYSGKKPKIRFTTTRLSTCIKLIVLYMYNQKMI